MATFSKTINFRAGQLHISIPSSPLFPPLDVFDLAERENPRRAFMFIHRQLGHYLPAPPNLTRNLFQLLAESIPAEIDGPVLFVGFAENAVSLACGIYQEARSRFPDSVLLLSTRHPIDGKVLCEFQENHSHATDHLIYQPTDPDMADIVQRAKTLVLIDDESTTGNTVFNAVRALEKQRNRFQQVISVNITDWSADALAARLNCPCSCVSLLAGQWSWTADPDAPEITMPDVNVSTRGRIPLSARQDWGRLGAQELRCDIGGHIQTQPGERILVIGTSEFVWPPFLLAERLQQEGADVLFCATTRSPLLSGHAITSAFTFADNYGQSIPHFLYNTQGQHYNRIFLCAETPLTSLPDTLLSHLNNICDSLECLSYA